MYDTVCEPQQYTVNRTCYETVLDHHQETCYRTVLTTAYRDQQYTVCKPVCETSCRQENYTVMRPVVETAFRECHYTVQKPVWTTRRARVPPARLSSRRRDGAATVLPHGDGSRRRDGQHRAVLHGDAARDDLHLGAARLRPVDDAELTINPVRSCREWSAIRAAAGGCAWCNAPASTAAAASGARASSASKFPARRTDCEVVRQCVPVQVCRMVPRNETVMVPVQVCKTVCQEVVEKYPVRRCNYVCEQMVQRVPYQVCRTVCEQHTRQVPVVTYHTVQEVHTCKVPICVPTQVPYTVDRCVPRTVCKTIPVSLHADGFQVRAAAGGLRSLPCRSGDRVQSAGMCERAPAVRERRLRQLVAAAAHRFRRVAAGPAPQPPQPGVTPTYGTEKPRRRAAGDDQAGHPAAAAGAQRRRAPENRTLRARRSNPTRPRTTRPTDSRPRAFFHSAFLPRPPRSHDRYFPAGISGTLSEVCTNLPMSLPELSKYCTSIPSSTTIWLKMPGGTSGSSETDCTL